MTTEASVLPMEVSMWEVDILKLGLLIRRLEVSMVECNDESRMEVVDVSYSSVVVLMGCAVVMAFFS